MKVNQGSEEKRRWVVVGFVVVSGLILFANLSTRTLENHDYLRYAEVAREMIRSGEWVVPHLNGEVYIDKPPLIFWLIALPSSLYGEVTPFLARLPGALAAWIGVVLLFFWAKRIYGTLQLGLFSGTILLSSYQYFFQARIAKTDMVLCLFILLTLWFFLLGDEASGKRRFLFCGLSFFFMGWGVLTKGPFGLGIPLLIMGVFLLKEKRFRRFFSREFFLGYAILAVTVLPWFFLFIHRVGWDRTIELVRENQILSRHAPFYFYFIEIWGQFFPWSLFLPFLFLALWRRRKAVLRSKESFFVLWFVLLFVVLSFFQYRASRYLLPALPPLALLLGGTWQKKHWVLVIPCFLIVLVWHGVDIYWVSQNLSHSPGRVLTEKLKPFVEGAPLSGYRLDVSTLEEVNFYMDRVIPVLKKAEQVSTEGFLLMPEEAYEEIRAPGQGSLETVRAFDYKKGKLVLTMNLGRQP